jgi:ubiquinone/menaquinone biosynthesis C-methylase UbiE
MKKEMDISQKWFQNWANEYDSTLGKVKRHHKLLDLVVTLSSIQKGDRVLDIGCGTGLLPLKFLSKKPCKIVAIDSSAEMLKLFQDKILECNLSQSIECVQMSAEEMNFEPNQFDIVAATVALHHVKVKDPVIRHINHMLKAGGRFVVGEIDMDTTGNVDDPKRLLRILNYLKEEFALAMQEGGVQAFERMYENGKKHILKEGEHCIGFKRWSELCRNAGFRKVEVTPLREFEWFKVLVARK